MAVFSSFLTCTTILFGIIAQMLLLDIRVKNLNGTRRMFFVFGNLLVLAVVVLKRIWGEKRKAVFCPFKINPNIRYPFHA